MLMLPAGHSESEADLARRIARQLGSDDLHVFWSDRPVAASPLPQQLPTLGQGLAVLAAVVGALASALGSRRPRAQRDST